MPTVAINFVLIVVARITDVSLDTIRTAAIIQGRRAFAALLGFFEAVIYICVVAKVLLNMKQPVYALAYGVGFASGTYLGILIEQYLAFGDQVISLFTRRGLTLSKALVDAGYRIAEVEAHVREGDLTNPSMWKSPAERPRACSGKSAVWIRVVSRSSTM